MRVRASGAIAAEREISMVFDPYLQVRKWLWFVAALVLAMVVVGGATRLTGSGLSITEWRPFMGAIPPLSESSWIAEFEKYKAIPQYELLNKGMSLGDFKFIYWWEWGHRQLGRFVGFAFMLPLLWFFLKGVVRGKMLLWLLFVGSLGGFQGAIGWIMVASGLQQGMTAVAPIKLALHLTTACIILVCLVWTARSMRPSVACWPTGSVRKWSADAISAAALVGLILVQVALGALVAGSKAGLTFNTWPLIDGTFIPPYDALFVVKPWIENFVDNAALVQFNHRMTAYALLVFAIWHWFSLRQRHATGTKGALLLAFGVVIQAVIGVVTLLLVVPLWAGLLHQITAAILLVVAVIHAEDMRRDTQFSTASGDAAAIQTERVRA
jgi:heme a synthase